jgi:hypothetical protein
LAIAARRGPGYATGTSRAPSQAPLDVVDVRELDAHDPLIEDRRDQMREGLVDPRDRRDVGGLKPAGEIRDRLEVKGAVFVVDHAVVEARGLDDPAPRATRTP